MAYEFKLYGSVISADLRSLAVFDRAEMMRRGTGTDDFTERKTSNTFSGTGGGRT